MNTRRDFLAVLAIKITFKYVFYVFDGGKIHSLCENIFKSLYEFNMEIQLST